MNAARDEFFAGTTFAEHEHGIVVLAHFLNCFVDALHAFGQADEATESGTRSQLFAE
jgi:hypothetical protein